MAYVFRHPAQEIAKPDWSVTMTGPLILGGASTITRDVAGVVPGQRVMVCPKGSLPSGFSVGRAWVPQAGKVSVTITTPALSIGLTRTFDLSVSVLQH